MQICLAINSFIRSFGNIGYITNQLTKLDRVYDQYGKIFLEQLTRHPQTLQDIVNSLALIFPNASYDDLYSDYADFIRDLEHDQFVVTGENEEDINHRMPAFNYSELDFKTLTRSTFNIGESCKETSEFLYEYFRQDPQIFSFQIELTSRCNEKCRHCYLPGSREMKDMDTSLVLDLLDQLADEGTLGLTLSGGECFLHKDFIAILEYARKKDFSISILSNILLLDDALIKVIKKANINLLQVSLYSMVPAEHDWVTQVPGSHQKTLQNLEKLIAENIPVQISCPTMKQTYKSYRDVLDWARVHRIKGYTDFIMMARTDHSTDNLDNRLSFNETKELLQTMLAVDTEYKSILDSTENFATEENLETKAVCGAGTDSMCIASNGNLYPCAGFQGYLLGNIQENSIHDIWRHSDKIKYLRNITWKDFPKCLKCLAKAFCSMCMVRNFNETGSIFDLNQHFCDVAFLNKEMVHEYKNRLN